MKKNELLRGKAYGIADFWPSSCVKNHKLILYLLQQGCNSCRMVIITFHSS